MGRYVDLLEKVTATYYDEQYEEWDHHTVTVEDVLNEVCDDYTIVEMPSAEPETPEKRTETHACDSIDRQAAIDTLNVGAEFLRRVLDDADIVGAERAKYEWGLGLIESYISDMEELPPAQPEIIRCCECRYWKPGYITDDDDFIPPGCSVGWVAGVWRATDYCSNAERRQNDQQ